MNHKTLIFTSDVHGQCSARSSIDETLNPYGLSRLSSYLKEVQLNNELVLANNGDTLQGSPLMTFAHKNKLNPNPITQVMNEMNFRFENIGNHDFNYGEERLLEHLENLDADVLTTNVLYKGIPIGSSKIHTFLDGTKVGFIGIITDYVPHWERAEHIKHFTFLDPIEVIKSEACELKKNVDFVFVLYHGGLEKDALTGQATEVLTGENIGYEMTQLDCIDVIISGHQHRSMNTIINNKHFLQCGMNASEVMRVDIVDHKLKTELVVLAKYEIDPNIEMLIDPYQKELDDWLDQVIGELKDGDCVIADPFMARLNKHPMVSLINQIQQQVSLAQISATSLFNHPLGFLKNIRMRDIVNNYVYPNSLVVKRLSGTQLKEYLEMNANYFILLNHEITVNPYFNEPKPQHFNYDMLDGIEYTYKISNPVGKRLISCRYQDIEIEDHDYFTVVMNNYRASGGGNFDMIARAQTVVEFPLDMTDLIADYIEKNSPVEIKHTNNIHIIL